MRLIWTIVDIIHKFGTLSAGTSDSLSDARIAKAFNNSLGWRIQCFWMVECLPRRRTNRTKIPSRCETRGVGASGRIGRRHSSCRTERCRPEFFFSFWWFHYCAYYCKIKGKWLENCVKRLLIFSFRQTIAFPCVATNTHTIRIHDLHTVQAGTLHTNSHMCDVNRSHRSWNGRKLYGQKVGKCAE